MLFGECSQLHHVLLLLFPLIINGIETIQVKCESWVVPVASFFSYTPVSIYKWLSTTSNKKELLPLLDFGTVIIPSIDVLLYCYYQTMFHAYFILV